MGNIGILAIGIVLIVAVLFIGYKMDTAPDKVQARKLDKDRKSKHLEDDYDYEYTDREESDIYTNENLYDMHYESDDNESYESDFVTSKDLMEENEYEEDDISLFENQSTEEYTFNNDLDDEISFETYDQDEVVQQYQETPEYQEVPEYEEIEKVEEEPEVQDIMGFEAFEQEEVVEPEDEVQIEEEPEIEPEPEKPKKTRGRPRKNKSEEDSSKPKRGRKAKKEVEPEPIVEEPEDDFSSTMIFDVDRLNAEIDSLDEDNFPLHSEEPEIEYSDAVDMDEKILELEDDDNFSEPAIDGPFKPVEEDAESFMDKINRMKEIASADNVSDFSVDNKDEELKAIHKKYTRKKTAEEIDLMSDNQISFIQEPEEEPKETVDIGFLAEMEKTLKQNQKDRIAKGKKKKDE